MWVSEIFVGIQGEGPNIGVLSTFIRFAGCNLSCDFCDSKFASKSKEFQEMSIEQILMQIEKFGSRNIVITGGEPFLQQGFMEFIDRIYLLPYIFGIEIETNGTIIPTEFINRMEYPLYKRKITLNISPKLQFIKKIGDCFTNIVALSNIKTVNLKFVINLQEKIPEKIAKQLVKIHNLLKFWNLMDPQQCCIYLMPKGTEQTQMVEDLKFLIDVLKEINLRKAFTTDFRVTPRLHVLLWGNKRGV